MRIVVTVDDASRRFVGAIAALAAKAQRVMVEGLNEGGDLLRTGARRDLRKQTGAKTYGTIVEHIGSRRAAPGALEYTIMGEGKGLPIRLFPLRSAVHRPVTAQPLGAAHTFARSFTTSRRGLLRGRRGNRSAAYAGRRSQRKSRRIRPAPTSRRTPRRRCSARCSSASAG
ncbi:hypothetical protein ACFZ8E_26810 [Methylobacterium sp. HMF5984]|uniref:hypothetical protein n=1 Tax=Methylobacterium sp. HMF5984 TaxID=3367370 RepID=UPI003851B7CB